MTGRADDPADDPGGGGNGGNDGPTGGGGGDRWRKVEQRYYLPDGNEELTTVIAFAVANAKGVDPTDLEGTLHDRIDAVALERTFFGSGVTVRSAGTESVVEFRYGEHLVKVRNDGRIGVFEPTDRGTSALRRGGRGRGRCPDGRGRGDDQRNDRQERDDRRERDDRQERNDRRERDERHRRHGRGRTGRERRPSR